ncbi:FAD-dependent monooxygenase [Amycolatopsis sp. ATCC 39116]|uniref:FAD-dependent monooxygenase n=1 Tax=Amycolatopsis sp. (strain ATCC 39116 / 75iv2) TaxID=385957 RepID=UPI00026288B8|nr:FAD-dependent monooxygenase [Amycolatopsis sp. ATCC 39116]
MTVTGRIPLLVAGGGIGGLATALAIARTGRPVHVLEQAPEFAEIGAGLQVGANATRAMSRLGIFDDVREVSVFPRAGVLMDAVTGERLTALDTGPSYVERYGHPYLVMHRSDLLDILLKHCTGTGLVTLENDKTVVHAEVHAGGATVGCADGTTYTCDALIAADGLHSRLRRMIRDDKPVCSGYAACRGTVPIGQVADVDADDVVIWIGPGMHLVQYPVRRGELYNQVAVFHSPRLSAGASEWGGPGELDAAFAQACAPVRRSVSLVNRDRHWPMFDREPLDRFVHERLALMGDAAHPMLQYLGQGACQALEDAVELARQLDRHDVDTAFAGYERRRLPRATRCQRTARPWGEIWHTADPLTRAVRNRMFQLRAPDDYTDVDWLYADPEGRA